jgi:hypothetical protein
MGLSPIYLFSIHAILLCAIYRCVSWASALYIYSLSMQYSYMLFTGVCHGPQPYISILYPCNTPVCYLQVCVIGLSPIYLFSIHAILLCVILISSSIDSASIRCDVLVQAMSWLHVPVERVTLTTRVATHGARQRALVSVLHAVNLEVFQLAKSSLTSIEIAHELLLT